MRPLYSTISATLTLACLLISTHVSAAMPSYKEVERFEREKGTDERNSNVLQPREIPSTALQSSLPPMDEASAREWGLSSQEFQRYRTLMQGSRGVYSPGLDPLTALGIEAQSDAERRRYAELQVRAEAQRVQKELAYDQAYRDAWSRLYPNLQPVQAGGQAATQASPAVRGNGRLAVFVTDSCSACTERVQALQSAGQAFDLYLIGSQNDDARIRRWAVLAGVDPAKVRGRQITLNHDAGRWVQLGLGGELPAVVREVNGQWLRQ